MFSLKAPIMDKNQSSYTRWLLIARVNSILIYASLFLTVIIEIKYNDE